MLISKIRNKSKGVFLYTIVGLIIVPFALVGLGDLGGGFEPKLTVGEIEISSGSIEYEIKNARQRIEREKKFNKELMLKAFANGKKVTDDTEAEMWDMYAESTKNRIINDALLKSKVDESGLRVSIEEIKNSIKNNDVFMINGKFDTGKYIEVLELNNISVSKYENNLLDALSKQKEVELLSTYMSNKVTYEANNKQFNEKIEIEYLDIENIEDVKNFAYVPTKQEIQDRFKKDLGINSMDGTKMYYSDEMVVLDTVVLGKKYFGDLVQVNDDKKNELYRTYSEGLTGAIKWDIRHSVAETQADADAFIGKMGEDELMADVAMGDLPDELNKFLKESMKGDTGVIKSEFGWHAVEIVELKTSKPETFDKVIEKLVIDYKEEMMYSKMNNIIEELDNVIYENSLEMVSEETGKERVSASGNMDSKIMRADESKIWKDRAIGNKGRVEVDGENIYWEITNIIKPEAMKIEEVKDEVLQSIVIEKKNNRKVEIANNLKDGEYEDNWVKTEVAVDFGKNEFGLVAEIASNKKDLNKIYIYNVDGDLVVYKVVGVNHATETWDAERINNIFSEELIQENLDLLKRVYKVVDETVR